MSANVTRGSFALDYIVEPRRKAYGIPLPIVAMIAVLLGALAATFSSDGSAGVAAQGEEMSAVFMGP